MIWGSLAFDCPYAAFLIILLLPAAWLFYALFRWRKEVLARFAKEEVRSKIMTTESATLYWIKVILLSIAFASAAAALSQPMGNAHYAGGEPAKAKLSDEHAKGVMRIKMHEVIILIDASASMGIKDTEAGKSRLETSKEIADQVISSLRGESVSLYSFTSVPMRAVPSTMDYIFTRLMLSQISVNEGETSGTNIQSALEAVREKYLSNPSGTTKTLIVLSDGGDTSLYGLEGKERNDRVAILLSPLAGSENQNLAAYAVGIGSKKGEAVPDVTYNGKPVESSLNTGLLERLALLGHGSYFAPSETSPFRTAQEISRLIAKRGEYIDVSAEIPLAASRNNTPIYDLFFQAPLAVALVALLIALFLPDTLQKSPKRVPTPTDLQSEAP